MNWEVKDLIESLKRSLPMSEMSGLVYFLYISLC